MRTTTHHISMNTHTNTHTHTPQWRHRVFGPELTTKDSMMPILFARVDHYPFRIWRVSSLLLPHYTLTLTQVQTDKHNI